MKKGRKKVKNYLLHLTSGRISHHKKLFWRLSVKNSIQDSVFLPFIRPKKVLGISPDMVIGSKDLLN